MIRFRPFPGITIATAHRCAILCGLGIWQLTPAMEAGADRHRERHMTAAPLSLDAVWR